MKRFLVLLIIAGTLAASAAMAQSRELQALVREAQGQVGAAIGPGATIAGISLNGQSLDYVFRFDRGAGADTSQGFLNQFIDIMADGLCQQPPVNAYIGSGGRANLAIVDPGGQALLTRAVTSCG